MDSNSEIEALNVLLTQRFHLAQEKMHVEHEIGEMLRAIYRIEIALGKTTRSPQLDHAASLASRFLLDGFDYKKMDAELTEARQVLAMLREQASALENPLKEKPASS